MTSLVPREQYLLGELLNAKARTKQEFELCMVWWLEMAGGVVRQEIIRITPYLKPAWRGLAWLRRRQEVPRVVTHLEGRRMKVYSADCPGTPHRPSFSLFRAFTSGFPSQKPDQSSKFS